jgi:NADPH-dependent curcumin reductase CurA
MTFITGSTAYSATVNVAANDTRDVLAITGSSGGVYGNIYWFAKADYIKLG